MRIENEMLSRFKTLDETTAINPEKSLSGELDYFFNNVLDTVVEYFTEKEETKIC